METRLSPVFNVFLVLSHFTKASALYLITDYYMDDGFPSAFGMACDKSIQDDCLYVNSHLTFFGIGNYGNDYDCTLMLDAGKQADARYKMHWEKFDLESTDNCEGDYLSVYDSNINLISNVSEVRCCGSNTPNFTGTQQYITIKFRTDGSGVSRGFRVMATRTLPAPCSDGYFHCKAENRCIDRRLYCDGTPQCDDRTDEEDCSFWEKLVGGLLALGVAGMIGVFVIVIFGCTSLCVGFCVCKKCCCKKRLAKVGDISKIDPKMARNEERLRYQFTEDNEKEKQQVSKINRMIVAVPKSSGIVDNQPKETYSRPASRQSENHSEFRRSISPLVGSQFPDRQKSMTSLG